MSIIFSHHALERLGKRHIAKSDVERTISRPDKTFPGKKSGTVKFIRRIDQRNHQVIAKKLENSKDWLVLSVWVRGEEDFNWVSWLVMLPFKVVWAVVKWVFRK